MDDQLLANKRVLVVEDEMLVVMAIEDMLADAEYNRETAVISSAVSRRLLGVPRSTLMSTGRTVMQWRER